MKPKLYDEESLLQQIELQQTKAWDLDRDIPWHTRIDLTKPLVALDDRALVFPGASQEERLVISQFFGLMVAMSIAEMEEALLRLKKETWVQVYEGNPVGPEFVRLGELFFEEERKHSLAFLRYVDLFCQQIGIDPEELRRILPRVKGTRTEWALKKHIQSKGHTFWWIVASVEQEFLEIYRSLEPFRAELEPLYFDLHQKHFLEEARHASFPYLMLELLVTRTGGLTKHFHAKTDLAFSQVLKTLWTFQALKDVKKVKKLQNRHPFFKTLVSALSLLDRQSPLQLSWQLMMRTPYVSSLIHPHSHQKILTEARRLGAIVVPFPSYSGKKKIA